MNERSVVFCTPRNKNQTGSKRKSMEITPVESLRGSKKSTVPRRHIGKTTHRLFALFHYVDFRIRRPWALTPEILIWENTLFSGY